MQSNKTGILLLNVGTPSAPNKRAVRQYLSEFLTDKRMIDLPAWLRYPLVYGLIAPLRAGKSAKNYQSVWCKTKGSPLLYFSQQCKDKLQEYLGESYKVALGMRYGEPSVPQALDELLTADCNQITVVPMYPQYASATTASSYDALFAELKKRKNVPKLVNINQFYQDSAFVNAFAQLIAKEHAKHRPEKIVLSYHGLPVKQIEQSEAHTPKTCYQEGPCPAVESKNHYCYRAQCFATTKLLSKALGLPIEQFETCFQSRLGPLPWIGPDFNSVLHKLAGKGVKNILVACPSFVADCLETLEEIGIQGKETWQKLGGNQYNLVSCLNDNPNWIKALSSIAAPQKRVAQED